MLDPKVIKKLKEDLIQINKIYSKIGQEPLNVDFNVENDLDTFRLIKTYLAEAKTYTEDIEDGFAGLTDSVVAITKDWKKGFADPTKEATKSMTKLKSLTEKLADDKNRITRLTTKELSKIVEQARIEKSRLDDTKRRLLAQKARGEELSSQEQSVLDNLHKGYAVQDDIISQGNKRVKQQEKIKELTGLTGQALEGASGILKKIGVNISSDKFKGLADGAKDYAEELNAANDGLEETDPKYLDEANIKAKVLGKTLKDSAKVFRDEIGAAINVAIIKSLKKGIKEFGESRSALAKTFALGREDANSLRNSMRLLASDSGTAAFNMGDAIKGIQEFNAELGGALRLTQDELKTFSLLSNEYGLTNKQAAELIKSSKLRGENAEDYAAQLRGQVLILAEQEGIAVNQQEVFANIGDISAANRLSMEGQGKSLANAAFQSAKLGMNQAQLEKTSSSLLDFESSIAAEMEAELMTGKQLNLEDARRAALMSDQEGLAKAISREIGTAAEFGEYNVLQQQSLAKAFGMSREELAETLETQELLTGEAKSMTAATDAYNKAMEDGVITAEEQRKIGSEQLLDQLKSEASSKRFADSMEQLKDKLVPVMDLLAGILDKLADAVQFVGSFDSILTSVGKMMGVIAGIRVFGMFQTALLSLKKIFGMFKGIVSMSSKLPTFLGGTAGAAGESAVGAAGKSTAGAAAGSVGTTATKAGAKGVSKIAGSAGSGIFASMKGMADKLNPFSTAKKWMAKNAGKFLGTAAKKIPFLGSLIEGIFASSDIKAMIAAGGDEKEVNQAIGKRSLQALGSVGGMALGGIGGTLIGGPVGTFIGAMAGDAAGRFLTGALADVLPMDGLGKMVRGIFPGSEPTGPIAEDFISRQGQPIQKFRADDIVMGGTKLNQGGGEGKVEQLLEKLLAAVEKGGDVYMDGALVGSATTLAYNKL